MCRKSDCHTLRADVSRSHQHSRLRDGTGAACLYFKRMQYGRSAPSERGHDTSFTGPDSLLHRLLAFLPQAKSAEAAIVDKRSTGGGVVNGKEPGWRGVVHLRAFSNPK